MLADGGYPTPHETSMGKELVCTPDESQYWQEFFTIAFEQRNTILVDDEICTVILQYINFSGMIILNSFLETHIEAGSLRLLFYHHFSWGLANSSGIS